MEGDQPQKKKGRGGRGRGGQKDKQGPRPGGPPQAQGPAGQPALGSGARPAGQPALGSGARPAGQPELGSGPRGPPGLPALGSGDRGPGGQPALGSGDRVPPQQQPPRQQPPQQQPQQPRPQPPPQQQPPQQPRPQPPPQQQQPQQPRPQPPPQQQQQPAAAAAPQGAVAVPPVGAEGDRRSIRRGMSRAPGLDVAADMQEMQLEEPRRSRYEDPEFRPENYAKKGTMGNTVTLRGNFFKIGVPQGWEVFQYHVDFMPPLDSTRLKKALLFSHDDTLGPVKVFDGGILFLPKKLPDQVTVVHSYTREENRQVKISIRHACDLQDVTPSTLQFLNVMWRKFMMNMNMKQIQRHYFDVENRIPVPQHNIEVIPGFQTSILRYENDILLDIDTTHKVLRTETVIDIIYAAGREHGYDTPEFKAKCEKSVIGAIVLTRYNNKNYIVDDIGWEHRPTDTFERHNNPITYVDYYRRQYDVEIQDVRQPMIVTRAKKRDLRAGLADNIFLVPELCLMTGLTEKNKADFNFKKDLATHTRIAPEVRVSRLESFMREVHGKEHIVTEMQKWSVTLEQTLAQIPGRQFGPEKLFMYQRGQQSELMYKQEESDWSRDMRGKTMVSAPKLDHWVIIFPRKCCENARSLCETLRRVAPPMGMDIAHPTPYELQSDRNDTYLTQLRSSVKGETQMVVCVLPNNRKDRYDAIKKFCCVDSPVPSQMVLDRTLGNQKRLMSVATKIAIQMNCKLGGSVWWTPIPLNKIMVIGFDTYHDSSRKGRSVGGVVATLDDKFTKYYSTTTFQTSHVELHNQLSSCVASCLKAYERHNGGGLPEKLLVFRDGVGDGQLSMVASHEIEQIMDVLPACTKMTFIVVKKRSIARFFKENPDGSGGRGAPPGRGGAGAPRRGQYTNPGPGTIIDDVATKPMWVDFYLVSQSVREGTVTPTHYNVIRNDTGLQINYIQRLAYKLCHMYYNWQGTIRVPAPCMYAHKLAFLVGQSLHTHPHMSLADKLFYL